MYVVMHVLIFGCHRIEPVVCVRVCEERERVSARECVCVSAHTSLELSKNIILYDFIDWSTVVFIVCLHVSEWS